MPANNKITSLGLLRGFAVLAVCFRHLAKPLQPEHNLFNPLYLFLKYGEFGVHVFFVISGFVIPYSLYKAGYQLSHYFQFLWKRVLRLHPPYLLALAITLVIAALSYKARHLPNPESIVTIFQSMFYLHLPADNPVFWTLQVEAEYYIFIGLVFALLNRWPRLALFIVVPVLLALSQTGLAAYIVLLKHIVFFLIGVIGFVIYTQKRNSLPEYLLLLCTVAYAFWFYVTPAALFAAATIAVILLLRKPIPYWLEFPGEISYSVYLIHFTIGVKLINLVSRRVPPDFHWALFILGVTVCVGCGWIFWKFVEKPSAKLSNQVKYGVRRAPFRNYNVNG